MVSTCIEIRTQNTDKLNFLFRRKVTGRGPMVTSCSMVHMSSILLASGVFSTFQKQISVRYSARLGLIGFLIGLNSAHRSHVNQL